MDAHRRRFLNSLRIAGICCVAAALVGACGGCASLARYKRKIVPDSVAACRDLQREGAAAWEQGYPRRAQQLLIKAVSASPADVDARRQLADVLWQGGRIDDALMHIERALELEPNHAPTVVRAGEMYAQAGQSARALELAGRAISLNHELAGGWALRGRILRDQRQYDRALADLQHALRYAPDRSPLLLDVAELHYQLGRPQRALTTLHHLLDGYAAGDEPQRALWLEGLAYRAVERPTEAAESLLAASQRGAPHPDLLYQLAQAEAAIGRPAAAREAVGQALALDADHEASRLLLTELQQTSGAPLRR